MTGSRALLAVAPLVAVVLALVVAGCRDRASTTITADPSSHSSASAPVNVATTMASTSSAPSLASVAGAPPAASEPPPEPEPPHPGKIVAAPMIGALDVDPHENEVPDLLFGAAGSTSTPGAGKVAGGAIAASPPPPPPYGVAPKLDTMPRCAFPPSATSDDARVMLKVDVDAKGNVTGTKIVSETPAGEGFAAAARGCIASTTFTPAKDAGGSAIAGSTMINVHFMR